MTNKPISTKLHDLVNQLEEISEKLSIYESEISERYFREKTDAAQSRMYVSCSENLFDAQRLASILTTNVARAANETEILKY